MKWLQGLSTVICCLLLSIGYASVPDQLRVELGVKRLSQLIEQNASNDRQGLSHLNRYIFSIDECDLEDRIRERGTSFIPDKALIDQMELFLSELAKKGIHLYVALNGEDIVVDELDKVSTNQSFSDSEQQAAVNLRVSQILDQIYARCPISEKSKGRDAILGITPVNWVIVNPDKSKSNEDLLRLVYLRVVKKGYAFPNLLTLINQQTGKESQALYSSADRNAAFERHIKMYASAMENYSVLVACPIASDFIEERRSKEPFVNRELIQSIADYLCTYGNDLSKEYNESAIANLRSWEKDYYFGGQSQNNNQAYERYLKALQKRNEWYKRAGEKIFTIGDQENMIMLTEWLSKSELRAFTIDQKISMLATIAKGPMNGDWVGTNVEGLALKILRSIKGEEAEAFLEQLITKDSKGKVLLYELISGIDDFGGSDNFTAFIGEVQRLVFIKNNISPEQALDKTYYQRSKYQLVWNTKSKEILPGKIEYAISHEDERTLSIQRKVCTQVKEVRDTDGITYDRTRIVCNEYIEDTPISLDYYDLVVIHFIDNPYYLEVCEQASCADIAFFTFAGYLDYLNAKKNTKDIETAVHATLLTASFAVGVGELNMALKGGQAIRALFAAWALSADVLDVVINTPAFENWLKLSYPQDWQSYRENLQVISWINLGTSVSGGLLYNAVKMRQAARFVATVEKLEATGGAPAKQIIALRQSARQIAKDMESVGQKQVLEEVRGEMRILAKEGDNLLSADGKFIDNVLEGDYQRYVTRKANAGKTSRERLDWKETRDYWLNDSPMARGNAFNNKAKLESWYPYDEVNLSNGKRLDSYKPPKSGQLGEIVSRKATNLDEIEISTFESYLREMQTKYSSGTPINSPKYSPALDNQVLQGKQILEIPSSNQNLANIQEYVDIAKKYNIEIRFRSE